MAKAFKSKARSRARTFFVALIAVITLAGSLAAVRTPSPPRPGKPVSPITPPGVRPSNPLQPPGEKSGDDLVQMTASADVAQILPGKTFLLAFVFTIEPGWHVYWENAGASGGPTQIDIKAPHGFIVGRTLFPRPQVLPTPEGACYGYEDEAVIFVEVTPPDTALAQAIFSAEASWMVCKEVCKLGSAKSMLSIPFGSSSLPSATPMSIHPAVSKFKARLPKELKSLTGGSVSFDGKELLITLPALKHSEVEVFPNPSPGVEFGEASTEVQGRQLRTAVPIGVNANNAQGGTMRVRGVIGVGTGLDEACYWFDIPLTEDGLPQPIES